MGSLTLKPVDPADPPDGLFPPGSVRGIVIYWRPAPSRPVKRPRRRSLQLPLPVWQAQHVRFHEVAPSGADEPRGRLQPPDPVRRRGLLSGVVVDSHHGLMAPFYTPFACLTHGLLGNP